MFSIGREREDYSHMPNNTNTCSVRSLIIVQCFLYNIISHIINNHYVVERN